MVPKKFLQPKVRKSKKRPIKKTEKETHQRSHLLYRMVKRYPFHRGMVRVAGQRVRTPVPHLIVGESYRSKLRSGPLPCMAAGHHVSP